MLDSRLIFTYGHQFAQLVDGMAIYLALRIAFAAGIAAKIVLDLLFRPNGGA